MTALTILLSVFVGIISPKDSDPGEKVLGSWNLIQYKYGQDEDYNNVPEFTYYVKNITKTHFSWCSYNPEDGTIIGAGGGTYSIDKKNYTEETEFWYPSNTSIPGTRTTFKYTFKGNLWTISGYIRHVELNPSSGEIMPIDSTYISEIWQRLGN